MGDLQHWIGASGAFPDCPLRQLLILSVIDFSQHSYRSPHHRRALPSVQPGQPNVRHVAIAHTVHQLHQSQWHQTLHNPGPLSLCETDWCKQIYPFCYSHARGRRGQVRFGATAKACLSPCHHVTRCHGSRSIFSALQKAPSRRWTLINRCEMARYALTLGLGAKVSPPVRPSTAVGGCRSLHQLLRTACRGWRTGNLYDDSSSIQTTGEPWSVSDPMYSVFFLTGSS